MVKLLETVKWVYDCTWHMNSYVFKANIRALFVYRFYLLVIFLYEITELVIWFVNKCAYYGEVDLWGGVVNHISNFI